MGYDRVREGAPEEVIEGTQTSSMQSADQNQYSNRLPPNNKEEEDDMHFEDMASAAKAAADSAQKAIAAAQAAAYIANRDTGHTFHTTGLSCAFDGYSKKHVKCAYFPGHTIPSDSPANIQEGKHHSKLPGHMYESHGIVTSRYSSDEEPPPSTEENKMRRNRKRHSYNVPTARSNMQFDESDKSDSDCDEDIEMETPGGICHAPDQPPPPVPSHHMSQTDDMIDKGNSGSYRRDSIPGVHPKLPDYETLAARFDALKVRKSS